MPLARSLGLALAVLAAAACAGAVRDGGAPAAQATEDGAPAAGWRLRVGGRVERPLALTYAELRSLPHVAERLVLVCPGNYERRAEWSGVPLAHVLALARPEPGATRVRLSGADGYAQEIPLELARGPGVLLADEEDGRPLRQDQGAPVRLVAPNQPGSVWVQQLESVEVR